MPYAPMHIRLFGPPEFRVNGEPLPRLKTRKGLYILALLTLRYGRDVERGWLAGTLWPENEESTALTYLRQALTDLRQALGDAAERLLSPSPRTLRLDVQGADVDFIAFEQNLKQGDMASLEKATALYRGQLLEGWAEEWLLGERVMCEQSYLSALETLARQATESRSDSAIHYLRLIVAADPLRESARRALMQALAATRDYAAVTQAYRELRVVLRRDLNVEPNAETQTLFARLRAEARRQASAIPSGRRETSVRTDAVPIAVPTESRFVSLPRPLSEFIGRVRETEAVKQTLTTSRLVTLTGIGGVGKTRLALRVAEESADDFPDGVRFIDMSPITEPALAARTAAMVLGVSEQPGRSLTETICERLRDRHLLLLLDNCEHLLDACARLAAALLQECPNVRILATSRQRLGITGETVRPVPPLTLPDLNRLPGKEKNDAGLIEYEAVRLFVDRARRIHPALRLDQRTLRAIAAICIRLDGIPLALELAAARMSALGPEQIAARLTERFRLLSRCGGDRAAPDRQRTLRAALDWSHDLLLPEEQILLRRLSVFAGGWSLEAAEAICAGEGLKEWDVMDCLTGLADHSLLVLESRNGEARYGLLETVREYAGERLREDAPGECAGLRVRRREYFLRLAQEAAPYLSSTGQADYLDRLESDYDNLRTTLDDCLADGTAEAIGIGMRLAGELQRFWMQRGHASEGSRQYAALLAHDSGCRDLTQERARALEGAGVLAFRQADHAAAREMTEQALAIYRKRGDRAAEAAPLSMLGGIACRQGDYDSARTLYEQALVLHRESGDNIGEGKVLNGLGNVAAKLGYLDEAQRLYQQALTISREVGDQALEASLLNGLGMVAEYRHDYAAARSWYERALIRHRALGDAAQAAVNLYNVAHVAFYQGDLAAAQDDYRQALLLTRTLGESRSRSLIAFLLEGMSITVREFGQHERAACLLGAADAQLEACGIQRTNEQDLGEYNSLRTALKAALGEARFAVCYDEGRALRIEQAVTLALEP